MNANTVKAALTPRLRKRSRREVENHKFDGFVRRILAAYGRRVGNGDVEALRNLAALSSEVDAVTRLAVAALRQDPYRYSWSEIADRLGISKQAAQQRYGDRAHRTAGEALDRRLLDAGLAVSVATLVQVYADHHPGNPAASVCPGCGYRYPEKVLDCPTNATVRPLLLRRRGENPNAVDRLTADQRCDLLTSHRSRLARVASRRTADVPSTPAYRASSLFDHAGKDTPR